MANLGTWNIQTDNTYQTVASKTGLTFESGTTYTFQIQNAAYIREGQSGKGFLINNTNPFEWTAGEDDLYINAPQGFVIVNISE